MPERAQAARALMQSRGFGVLCTNSKRLAGFPFGSAVNFATDAAGRPVFFFSALAVHTKNLTEDPHASLTVYDASAEQDVLTGPRMNVMGEIHPVPDDEAEAARAAYFQRHPDAEQYMGFADFQVYRMNVVDVYYVGGFGAMGWVSPKDYTAAE